MAADLGGENWELFFGEPLSVTLKDDITLEEYRQMLRAPGIIYIRNDSRARPILTADLC